MEKSEPWIQTYTGRQFFPGNPQPEQIDVRDIAHHLSLLCRYTGACRRFYSVAEHSVLMARFFQEHSEETYRAKCALLHDATEAYLNDIARPVKHLAMMDGYRELEENCWRAVAARFGLHPELPADIHSADIRIFRTEYAVLMAPAPGHQAMSYADWPPLPVEIQCWAPEQAEFEFLKTFGRLFK